VQRKEKQRNNKMIRALLFLWVLGVFSRPQSSEATTVPTQAHQRRKGPFAAKNQQQPSTSQPQRDQKHRKLQKHIPTLDSKKSSKQVLTKNSSSAWLDGLKSGLASALAAGTVKTVLQPIDAIKTAQQYSRTVVAAGNTGGLNIIEACRQIVSKPGGMGNFYAGWGVTVLGSMPSVALYFGVYSSVKKILLTHYADESRTTTTTTTRSSSRVRRSLCVALAAAIGNSVASFSRVPYEVLKQQLQTKAYDNTWQALAAIAASPQRMSLIFPPGGIAIQMIRDVPYAVVTLLLYESLQARFANSVQTGDAKKDRRLAQVNDFVLGGIAGGFGSWVTNPFDVIKTRLQTDLPGDASVYGGSVAVCAQAVWEEGGPMAFLRGSVPRLVHKVPANAFFFLFYEVFRRLLGVQDTRTAAASEATSKQAVSNKM